MAAAAERSASIRSAITPIFPLMEDRAGRLTRRMALYERSQVLTVGFFCCGDEIGLFSELELVCSLARVGG
jgi:hypothetical protein